MRKSGLLLLDRQSTNVRCNIEEALLPLLIVEKMEDTRKEVKELKQMASEELASGYCPFLSLP